MKALTVAAKEFRGFLRMPLGYALLGVYALISGMTLVTLLTRFHDSLRRAAEQAHIARAAQPVLDGQVFIVSPYFLNCAALLIFIIPFLTMRSFAEEKRSRSLELLVSFPLSAWEIVLGKFLGIIAFTFLMYAISLLHVLILFFVSTPEVGPVLLGLGGMMLLGTMLVAMGSFISSLSMGQVEAAVLTLGLFLVLVMVGEVTAPGSALQGALRQLSPLTHFENFGRGVLAWQNLLVLTAGTVLFLGLTLRGMDLLKWRG